jgi:tetratricopeptide (TPR) repeat protein
VLFDLRDPRRKNAIRVIYAMLAVLMGGGLILFGIGGEVSGGLFDGLGIGSGGGGTTFEDQIEDAEKEVEENPRDQQALLDLVTLNIQAGNEQVEGFDEETGFPITSSDTEESFGRAADAWDRYLALNPPEPDSGAALVLATSFFTLAINATTAGDARRDIAVAAEAQRVAAEGNPGVANFRDLARYLYLAGEFAAAERAADRALAQAPPAQTRQIRRQLKEMETVGRQFDKQVTAEAKGTGEGGNPLEESGGALGGGGGLGGGALSPP